MLPKISEERFADETRIQDFCASLHLTQQEKSKEKLQVRSVFESVENEKRRQKTSPGSGKTRSNAVTRFKDGFSKTHLQTARSSSKSKLRVSDAHQKAEIIDLRKQKDAEKIASRFYEDLYSDKNKSIDSYLDRFACADFTFPKLWTREQLFELANRQAGERCKDSVGTRSNVLSARNENTYNRKNHSAEAKTKAGFLSECIFYSKPVELRTTRRSRTLPRVKSWPVLTNNRKTTLKRKI